MTRSTADRALRKKRISAAPTSTRSFSADETEAYSFVARPFRADISRAGRGLRHFSRGSLPLLSPPPNLPTGPFRLANLQRAACPSSGSTRPLGVDDDRSKLPGGRHEGRRLRFGGPSRGLQGAAFRLDLANSTSPRPSSRRRSSGARPARAASPPKGRGMLFRSPDFRRRGKQHEGAATGSQAPEADSGVEDELRSPPTDRKANRRLPSLRSLGICGLAAPARARADGARTRLILLVRRPRAGLLPVGIPAPRTDPSAPSIFLSVLRDDAFKGCSFLAGARLPTKEGGGARRGSRPPPPPRRSRPGREGLGAANGRRSRDGALATAGADSFSNADRVRTGPGPREPQGAGTRGDHAHQGMHEGSTRPPFRGQSGRLRAASSPTPARERTGFRSGPANHVVGRRSRDGARGVTHPSGRARGLVRTTPPARSRSAV